MVATFLVLGALLLACSGLAEGQSIHVSLRITKRDPLPSRVDEFPYRPYSSHRFGRTGASPEEHYLRPVSGGAHVNLRLNVKLPLQIPADTRRFKFSFPGEERIPFDDNFEEIENHVTRSAMQNIFDSLASAGIQADQVKLANTAEDRYYENSGSCSCGHDHAHASTRVPLASTVGPREFSVPIDPFFMTSPFDAVPHDHRARYGDKFQAYDHQNGGSNVGFMTFRHGLQEQNTGRDGAMDETQLGARYGVSRMSERAAEKKPRRKELINKFEPVYKKKQPKYHISFV